MAKKATRKKATKKKATRKVAKKKATRKKATKKKATRKVAKKKATRKTAKKKATRKVARKKTAKKKTKRKPNKAFMRPLRPSSELSRVVGATALPRTQAIKKIWSYIKKNALQNPKNRRNILADAKLRPIFGKAEVSMFELTALVSKHLN